MQKMVDHHLLQMTYKMRN